MATVIVPAHNEAGVIESCLQSIVGQEGVDHIIVACNGCTDNTVDIVQQKYPSAICLDIKKPSKVNALNEAEIKAKEIGVKYPIFYIDADTQLSENCIQHIIQALDKSHILLAAPTPMIDTSKSSWLVKQYYQIWVNLPYIKEGVIATCSYIITEQGRQRFKKFPSIINDDGYVRCHFKNNEIANISGTEIYIQAPRDIFSLIKIKTRARLGNMELSHTEQCPIKEAKHYGNVMMSRLFSRHFISAAFYIVIALIIRVRSRLQLKQLQNYKWEKDLSSR
jgi:glycosyltransferase involved in cell wall biosynthesis